MRDIDAVRHFRTDLPALAEAEVAEVRSHLIEEIGHAKSAPRTHHHLPFRRLVLPLAVACALLAATVTFTGPGRAVAGGVGRFLGIDSERPSEVQTPVPESGFGQFSVLTEPVPFSSIPLAQRAVLMTLLPAGDQAGFERGAKHLPGGIKITIVGNRRALCFSAIGPTGGGGGNCASTRWALNHGLTSFRPCRSRAGDKVWASGVVPDGVEELTGDRTGAGAAETIPVVGNAFSAVIDVPQAFRARGNPGAEDLTINYPRLAREPSDAPCPEGRSKGGLPSIPSTG